MQKLSYRDRILILVVFVGLILVAGFMLMIKPKWEEIQTTEDSYSEALAEWEELEEKISQVDEIEERVKTKYNESVQIGSLFLDLKRAYKLEDFIKDYIDKNGIYIDTNAEFTDPSVVTLTPYSLSYETLEYDIADSADLNKTKDESSENSTSSSSSDEEEEVVDQELPCGTITIDYYATRAGLLQFMQDIKDSGKSIEIKSLTIDNNSYSTDANALLTGDISLNVYYAQMISDIDIGKQIEDAMKSDQ